MIKNRGTMSWTRHDHLRRMFILTAVIGPRTIPTCCWCLRKKTHAAELDHAFAASQIIFRAINTRGNSTSSLTVWKYHLQSCSEMYTKNVWFILNSSYLKFLCMESILSKPNICPVLAFSATLFRVYLLSFVRMDVIQPH